MSSKRTPEIILREALGYQSSLVRFFAMYETTDVIRNKLIQMRAVIDRLMELGEVITNDPDNKAARAEIEQLESETRALTKQLTKQAGEIDQKDTEITALKARIKELEKKDKE